MKKTKTYSRHGRSAREDRLGVERKGIKRPRVVVRDGRLSMAGGAVDATGITSVDDAEEASEVSAFGFGRKALIVLFILSLLAPFTANLGPLRLTPVLFYLLLAFLPSMAVWLFRRPVRLTLADALIPAYWIWASFALSRTQNLDESVQGIGVLLLQSVGAFALGRILVRDASSTVFLAKVMTFVATTCAALALAESLTGIPVALRLASILGPSWPGVQMEPRLHLHRAQVFFEHPILFGVFSASLLSLLVYWLPVGSVKRKIGVPAAVLASFLSLSTGALLSLNVQLGLMVWARIFKKNLNRWQLLAAVLAAAYIVVDLISTKTPFHVFVNYATFSSGSSYNRILIWQFGSASALNHPLFGVGMGEWDRPSWMHASMDNFWLLQAVRYGIPAFVFLFGAMVVLMARARWAVGPSDAHDRMRRGFIFALIGTCVTITSVHLWNSAFIWLMFLAGCGGWLGTSHPGKGMPVSPALNRG